MATVAMLSCVVFQVARAHKGWALDSVVLHNDVTHMNREDITAPPTEGVYVYGLYLDGAGWDRHNSRLVEPPLKVLYVPMPVMHILPSTVKKGRTPNCTCAPHIRNLIVVVSHVQWISLYWTPVNGTFRLLPPCHNLVQYHAIQSPVHSVHLIFHKLYTNFI